MTAALPVLRDPGLRRTRQGLAALLLAGLLQGCAAACDFTQGDVLPMTFDAQGKPLVPVEINSEAVPFLLDTGASLTALLPEGARRLNLQQDPLRRTELHGIGGRSRESNVLLGRLRIGQHDLRNLTVPVALHSVANMPMVGLLGADILSRHEIEIDGPGRRVVLHDTSACAVRTPPWPGISSSLPMELLPSRQVVMRVLVNGVATRAIFDTGAQRSALRLSVARRAGMTEAAALAPPVGRVVGIGPEASEARLFRVETIGIGEESFRNSRILVTEFGEHAAFDMVLGQDFIARRRFWLSYARQQLYVWREPKPESGTPSPAP